MISTKIADTNINKSIELITLLLMWLKKKGTYMADCYLFVGIMGITTFVGKIKNRSFILRH